MTLNKFSYYNAEFSAGDSAETQQPPTFDLNCEFLFITCLFKFKDKDALHSFWWWSSRTYSSLNTNKRL